MTRFAGSLLPEIMLFARNHIWTRHYRRLDEREVHARSVSLRLAVLVARAAREFASATQQHTQPGPFNYPHHVDIALHQG